MITPWTKSSGHWIWKAEGGDPMYLIGLQRGLGTLRVEKNGLISDNIKRQPVIYSVM
jgi:hypothetical protein